MVERYGADTTRLYSLFLGPPDQDAEWQDGGVAGQHRFLARLWRLVNESVERVWGRGCRSRRPPRARRGAMVRKAHWAIDKVTEDTGSASPSTPPQSAVHELVGDDPGRAVSATGEQLRFALRHGGQPDPSVGAAHRL